MVGEDGRLRVEAPWRPDWGGAVLVTRGDEVTTIDVPEADSFVCELENFADAVAGISPPLLGREDAVGPARTINALYRSAEAGAPVSI